MPGSQQLSENSWHHIVVTHDGQVTSVYVDGQLHFFGNKEFDTIESDVFNVGFSDASHHNGEPFLGALQSVGMWNRALSEEEVAQLYQGETPVFGCLDSNACNFDAEANMDNDSCFYECEFCQNGTVWDNDLGACVATLFAENACLEGTVWNEELGGCVVANPSDTDFDGCVGMTDLLGLLSVFGTCNETPWSCGDPLEYQGYDYETVQIGEQCWFAENLRCEEYGNGDPIPANLSDAEWTSTHSGAKTVYGEENATCQASYSPEGDACNDSWSLAEFGYLYNWYAATDPRGLCPSGWHLPSDNEWTLVTNHLGGDTVAGGHLKATSGWNEEGVGGSNSSGFSGLPGGHRYYSNGNLNHAGNRGYWWSSSSVGSVAWLRRLDHDSGAVVRYNNSHRDGHSVRCIQDSE